MPSTYTGRARLEKQAAGENNNTWGDRLNDNVIELIDEAMDGVEALTVSGSVTLTTNNAATDQARKRVLDCTGTGGTVTIPNVEKMYHVRNATSGTITFTTGSGTTAVVAAGAQKDIFCAGGNVVRQASGPDFGTMALTAGNITGSGTLSCTGNATLGDAAGDSHTINGRIALTSSTATNAIAGTLSAASGAVGFLHATSATYASPILTLAATRAGSSSYTYITALNSQGGTPETDFSVRGDGLVASDSGTTMSSPADYAEMFEWADGNKKGEDRVGCSVALDGNKIQIAKEGDEPIGVISGNPAVLADNDWNRWQHTYLKDDFNRPLYESFEVWVWRETTREKVGQKNIRTTEEKALLVTEAPAGWEPPKGAKKITEQRRALNPEFDPARKHETREARKEWDAVGLMGKLRVRKGQVTGARWLKMRDISANVEEWLVR